MFKKLKDKLAEEVKSSPQRIQQFAQAAQAAVTSASSSISDITNTDLFSIGDNEKDQNKLGNFEKGSNIQPNTFQDVSLMQSVSENKIDASHFFSNQDNDTQRQRRLSNSSFASDVSFRLPSYESPSTYQLQSDVDISASEAEERGFSTGTVSLDRVTKEQIYSAYKRTQERYVKYRTQYADLVRHYKLLERENAKARSVLVETQDKALRRISELREQCSLEQSAKAHLEKALRVEIEEKNIQIETLNTKINLLRNSEEISNSNEQKEAPFLNLTEDEHPEKVDSKTNDALLVSEITVLNNKVEKLEQLINKYKESLKTAKEKNSQITSDLQILSNELENKNKENKELRIDHDELKKAKTEIQKLNEVNEQLQNQINSYDFNKLKEISTLEIELEKSQDEIKQLQGKIEQFLKNEEEYAISLAENKLSIHKELESKENEIRSLKDTLSGSQKEIQSLNIVIEDYKKHLSQINDDKSKLNSTINELNEKISKVNEYESQVQLINQKYHVLENNKAKADEEIKCLHLQLKQETAEKLAMIDRNAYLESKNSQLSEENSKKSSQIVQLESLITRLKEQEQNVSDENTRLMKALNNWESKYYKVESEIQDEKCELVKLQTEIENLMANHELLTSENLQLNKILNKLKEENSILKNNSLSNKNIRVEYEKMLLKINDIKQELRAASEHILTLSKNNIAEIINNKELLCNLFSSIIKNTDHDKASFEEIQKKYELELSKRSEELLKAINELTNLKSENIELQSKLVSIQNELLELKNNYECTANQFLLLKNEKETTHGILEHMEDKCHKLEVEVDALNNDKMVITRQIEELNQEKENNIMLIQNTIAKRDLLQNEMELLREEIKYLSNLKRENEALKDRLTKLDEKEKLFDSLSDKIKYIEDENFELKQKLSNIESESKQDSNKMLEKNRELLEENLTLKNQSERILNDIERLETEISAVRISHAQIESEKDHLNTVIKLLEEKETEDRHCQTILPNEKDTLDKFTNTEIEELPVTQKTHVNISESFSGTENTQDDVDCEVTININDYNKLKVENRRLQSEITGLQTYLANISKENSTLNDKLREVIVSSENFSYQNETSTEIKNNNLWSKIEELTRENTLLIDENLELKDQLNSQNNLTVSTTSNNNDHEISNLKEKYSNLLNTKIQLEKKIFELESMTNSVNGTMAEMQENNSKLRKSNEKLERRLDEALVSLRHLHSLQENTELEYLRNILYEYLTGPGTHSITLAKVLAAVVKFDAKQTQYVLQKEKERQGLLRQLGLL